MLSAAEGASLAPRAEAAGAEAVGAAVGAVGGAAHTVVVFAAGHAEAGDVLAGARRAARGARVVGCTAAGVLSGAGEHEDGPAVVALALAGGEPAQPYFVGEPADLAPPDGRGLALAFADGYSMHPEELARGLAEALPGWIVAGGVATGEGDIYPAHRFLDDEVGADGVAGLLLRAEAQLTVTQGCRPIGATYLVTHAHGRVLERLDGRPAFEVFADRARPLLDDLPRAAQVLFLAVTDGDVDFTLRGLVGFDPDRGLLASSEPIPEGARLRFAVREPGAARADLRGAVADLARRLEGRPPRAGFYFCCAGRGRGLFGVSDHDVAYIQGALGRFPMAGFFGGGEIGPGQAGARMHLFSGVLAVIP
jgi:small ligand-binding sensory domain FIST